MRMRNRCLSISMQTWCRGVIIAKDQGREEERRKQVMSKIVKRMLHGTLSAGFGRWHQNMVEKRAMAAKALKVVGRWVNQCVSRSMDAWHEHTVKEKRTRGLMSRIIKRLQHRGITMALSTWAMRVEEIVAERIEAVSYTHLTLPTIYSV